MTPFKIGSFRYYWKNDMMIPVTKREAKKLSAKKGWTVCR